MSGKNNANNQFSEQRQDTNHMGDIESLTNIEILDMLEKMMSDATDNEVNANLIEHCLEILQKRAPVMEDYDEKSEMDKFRQRHSLIFDESLGDAEVESRSILNVHSKKTAKNTKILSRVAAILAIIAGVAILGTATASAFGINIWEVIASWTIETFQFVRQ